MIIKWSEANIYFFYKHIVYAVLVIEADIQDNAYTVSQFPFGNSDTMRVKKITVTLFWYYTNLNIVACFM